MEIVFTGDSRKLRLCVLSRINSGVPSRGTARDNLRRLTADRAERRREKKNRIFHTSASTFTGRVVVDRTTEGDTYLIRTGAWRTFRRERRTSVFPRSLEPRLQPWRVQERFTTRTSLARPWGKTVRCARILPVSSFFEPIFCYHFFAKTIAAQKG